MEPPSPPRYRLVTNRPLLERIEYACSRSPGRETGGILVGRYSDDGMTVLVRGAGGPPPDSVRGPCTFVRGTSGVDEWLARLWRHGAYYLGEWHLHPDAPATASPTDLESLRLIATNPDYHCANPVLLIVGGGPLTRELRWWMWVDGAARPLTPCAPGSST